jgi:hypothetical protein
MVALIFYFAIACGVFAVFGIIADALAYLWGGGGRW